ncbi:MAG TPA: carboxymuconolactone decarboxylase family protein [Terriglobales bacterium]|nr:carboxymuconolactone decarboxylase family protein [Terriglobales bacterium]
MPRIKPVVPGSASGEVAAVYEELKKSKWRVPVMYQVLAHHLPILKCHEAYFDAVMNKGLLDRKLKEKVAYKVARLNACAYSSASHRRYAIKCGASEEEMTQVDEMRIQAMAARDAAALRLAVALNESGHKVSKEIFQDLESHFSPAEIIELFAVVGLMAFASRLADGLGLEAEK